MISVSAIELTLVYECIVVAVTDSSACSASSPNKLIYRLATLEFEPHRHFWWGVWPSNERFDTSDACTCFAGAQHDILTV